MFRQQLSRSGGYFFYLKATVYSNNNKIFLRRNKQINCNKSDILCTLFKTCDFLCITALMKETCEKL